MSQVSTYTYAVNTAMLQNYQIEGGQNARFDTILARTNDQGTLDVLALDSDRRLCVLLPDSKSFSGWRLARSQEQFWTIVTGPSVSGGAQRMYAAADVSGKTELSEIAMIDGIGLYKRRIAVIDGQPNKHTKLRTGLCQKNGSLEEFITLSGHLERDPVIMCVSDGSWYRFAYSRDSILPKIGGSTETLGKFLSDRAKTSKETTAKPNANGNTSLDYTNVVCDLAPQSPDTAVGTWPNLRLVAKFEAGVPNFPPTPVNIVSFVVASPVSVQHENDHDVVTYEFHHAVWAADVESTTTRTSSFDVVRGTEGGALAVMMTPYEFLYNMVPPYVPLMDSGNVKGAIVTLDTTGSVPENAQIFNTSLDKSAFPARMMKLVRNMREELELTFLADADDTLYHTGQVLGENERSHWLPIAENCKTAAVGTFANSFTQILTANTLHHFLTAYSQKYTSELDSPDENAWNEEEILWIDNPTQQGPEKIVEGQAYRTCVTITDEHHNMVLEDPVVIGVENYTPCSINGRYYELQPGVTVTVPTNAIGQINFEYVMHDGLTSPVINFFSAKVGQQIAVRPDRDTVQFLQNISPDNLSWTDGDGKSIMGDYDNPNDRAATADAIRNVSARLTQIYGYDPGDKSCFVSDTDFFGVTTILGDDGSIPIEVDAAKMDQQAYIFKEENGRLVFHEISAEEFRGLGNGRVNASQLLLEDCDDVANFFGDLFEASMDVAKSVVSIAWQGTDAVVRFVIEGVEYFVETAIKTARDVFAVVCTIMDKLGSVVGLVMKWVLHLLKFLFNWDEILRIKDRIKRAAETGLDQCRDWLTQNKDTLGKKLTDFLDTAEQNFEDNMQQVMAQPLATGVLIHEKQNVLKDFQTAEGVSFWNSGTWLLDELLQKVKDFLIDGAGGLPSLPDQTLLANFISEMTVFSNELTGAAATKFAAAKATIETTFAAFLKDPASLLDLSLNAVLGLVKDVLIAVIDLVEMCVDKLVDLANWIADYIDSLKQWLKTEIYIPFLSAFYESLTENKMSLFDICCLVLAVPTSTRLHSSELDGSSGGAGQTLTPEQRRQRVFAIVAGVSVIFAEVFWQFGMKYANVGLSICGRIFKIITGVMFMAWDELQMPSQYFGLFLLIENIIGLISVVLSEINQEFAEFYAKVWGPIMEGFSGLAGVAASLAAFVIGVKEGKHYETDSGVAGLCLGIKTVGSSAVALKEKPELLGEGGFRAFSGCMSAISAPLLFIAAGQVDQ